MFTDALKKIGLTNNEVKVYLALLETGPSAAGELIKKIGLHRTVIYDTLERLIEKGIVSYAISRKIKIFEVVEPKQLLSYIEQRKNELDDNKKEIEKLIPELNLKRKLSKDNQEATIFKGKLAIKTIAEDVIDTKKTWYVFGAQGKLKEFFPSYYHHFHNKRIKKGIKMNIIYCEKVRKEKRNKELRKIDIRYIPDEFETPANTWIFGDKIAIIVWSEQPIATVIRSKDVAKSYLTNFELLWKIAKK